MTPEETAAAEATAKAAEKQQEQDKAGGEELFDYVFNGQTVRLTKDQRDRATHLGLVKAAELAAEQDKIEEDKNKKPVEEPKPEDKNEAKEQIAQLRKELEEKEERQREGFKFNQTVAGFDRQLKDAEIDVDFEYDLKLKALALLNEAKNKKIPVNDQEVMAKVIKDHKKRMEKFQPRVNVDDKEKDKKKVEKSGFGGKGSGQEQPKPLGRNAFRDGSLTKRIGEKVNKLVNQAIE